MKNKLEIQAKTLKDNNGETCPQLFNNCDDCIVYKITGNYFFYCNTKLRIKVSEKYLNKIRLGKLKSIIE